MPRYDYECPICGAITTHLVPHESEGIISCLGAQGATHPPIQKVRRPSAPSFVVKGFNAANGYSRNTTR